MNDSRKSRVLVDATNLTTGGAVQVASATVDCLLDLLDNGGLVQRYPWLASVRIEISDAVASNLSRSVLANDRDIVIRTSRWNDAARWSPFRTDDFSLHFVILGPRYGLRRSKTTLVGIADGTAIYDHPDGLPRLAGLPGIKKKLRNALSRWIFARESFLVSESRSLLEAFAAKTHFPRARTCVVPNAVNPALLYPELGRGPELRITDRLVATTVTLGYVTRGYPHKNLRFLGLLGPLLAEQGIEAKFLVTLTEPEWQALDERTRASSINVGPISIGQLRGFYAQCTGVIFPSLLESQSVTPLEAMACNGLLFASDRPFVRESCGDAAVYFDPLDAEAASRVIARTLKDPQLVSETRNKAAQVADLLPTSQDRTLRYIELIDSLLDGPGK